MKGSKITVAAMFGLAFMVGFVTMFTGPIGGVVKAQFGASNAAAQFGASANFLAYLFTGIPAGMILRRKGYKFTSLLAVSIGALGVAVQILAGVVGSFSVYVAGAFIAGLSMASMFTAVNPMLNELGGGGNGGNRLIQYGCTFNSVGGMSSPMILGWLFGAEIAKARVLDAMPAQLAAIAAFVAAFVIIARAEIAEPHREAADAAAKGGMFADFAKLFKFRHFVLGMVAVFLFEPIESGIPFMANLYFTQEGAAWYKGAAYAGTVVSLYCLCMMGGRFLAGLIASKVSTRAMMSVSSVGAIAMLLGAMYSSCPVVFIVASGFFTSVMFGGLINLALEGLGNLATLGSGILMSLICGGALLTAQGALADRVGCLNSYWMTIGLVLVMLVYSLFGSKVAKRADGQPAS